MVSRISLGPLSEGTKPLVTAVITVEPSAILGTFTICAIIFARKREGEAIIRNSLSVATSITSFEQIIDSCSL